MLSLQGIAPRHDARTILAVMRLHIACDQVTVILGHNGSGKSTLMNLMADSSPPIHAMSICTTTRRDSTARVTSPAM